MSPAWLVPALLALNTLPTAAEAAPAAPAIERWAGHQVVVGGRNVPLIGEVKTRTDSFLLAEVERRPDGTLQLRQEACKVEIAQAAGVKVAFLPEAEQKLPASAFELREKGGFYFADFRSGWDEADVDGDGNPGATMVVKAPICSGKLHVASQSHTQLRLREADGGFRGDARAISDQKTLGAEGACLKVMSSDTRDAVRGKVAYRPVAADATCASLLADESWPAEADEPVVAGKAARARR